MTGFSHFDEAGNAVMVDVTGKAVTERIAVASGRVLMRAETLALIERREVVKGDVLSIAQLAGIMAAKRTAELIPLCHPLALTHIDVRLEVGNAGVDIESSAETTAATGVEMEALVAASVAALTIYDMAKAIDKEMAIEGVRLVSKTKEKV
jgi:cyclic pyranopterin monophosphate synthase